MTHPSVCQVQAYSSKSDGAFLNRLPPLYATSVEGWRRQQQWAIKELESEITSSVRQGLAAVQRDPLRIATPLSLAEKMEVNKEQVTEEELQNFLKCCEMV